METVVKAAPGKEWAENMTEEEFAVAWARKHPTADRPNYHSWIVKPFPEYHGITEIEVDEIILEEDEGKKPEQDRELANMTRTCRHCGRVFLPIKVRGVMRVNHLGYAKHETKCQKEKLK